MRKRTELENGESANEESIDSLDKQLAESKFTLAASESKFDDISRKLATLEADATRGNERAEVFYKHIFDSENLIMIILKHHNLCLRRLDIAIDHISMKFFSGG